jgi:hypothetical protein
VSTAYLLVFPGLTVHAGMVFMQTNLGTQIYDMVSSFDIDTPLQFFNESSGCQYRVSLGRYASCCENLPRIWRHNNDAFNACEQLGKLVTCFEVPQRHLLMHHVRLPLFCSAEVPISNLTSGVLATPL